MILRLVLVLVVFGLLALGLLAWICKGYYDEWVLLKSKELLKEEMARDNICGAFDEGRRITEADIDAKTNGIVELLDHDIRQANVDLTEQVSSLEEQLRVSLITTNQVVDPIQVAREQELLEANRVLRARVLQLEGQIDTSKRSHDRELHRRDVELDRAREDFIQASSVNLLFISELRFSF